MRVLLTGATGFIGSHLLIRLVKMNVPVAIVLREGAKTWRIDEVIDKVFVIRGDLSDPDTIQQPIITFAPDVVIHLAWYGVENRYRNEYQQLSINLLHITNLLQVIERTNVKKLIGFGSQGEYGPQNVPIDERIVPQPTTLYGVAKLCAYNIFELFCRQRSMDFSWVRLFSIYGPKDNDSWLIPSIITQLLAQKSPELTEGRQTWDFLYIDDAVDAIISILQSKKSNGIFNLGSGTSPTIRQTAEKIRDAINPAIQLRFGLIPYRSDQVMFLQANIDRLKNITGWTPQVSLEQGIQRTIAWYKLT